MTEEDRPTGDAERRHRHWINVRRIVKNRRAESTGKRKTRHRHLDTIPEKPVPPWRHPLKALFYYQLMFRWRMAVATTVHPVGVAMIVALAICAFPLYAVLHQQADIRHNAQTQKAQQKQIADLLGVIQADRRRVTVAFCGDLNANARTNNAQLRLFQGIIVNGAKSGRAFDKLYRDYGFPPYRVRLAQAKKQAAKIEALKLPLLDCEAAVQRIQGQASVPPPGSSRP